MSRKPWTWASVASASTRSTSRAAALIREVCGASQGGGAAARRAMSMIVSAALASRTPYSVRMRATSSGPTTANPVSTRTSQSGSQPSRAAAWS
jgi:hypothetical protein